MVFTRQRAFGFKINLKYEMFFSFIKAYLFYPCF